MRGFAPRFAIEAGFLILLGVGAGYADLRPAVIVGVVAGGWVLVALVELAVWRSQARPAVGPRRRLREAEPRSEPAPEPEPAARRRARLSAARRTPATRRPRRSRRTPASSAARRRSSDAATRLRDVSSVLAQRQLAVLARRGSSAVVVGLAVASRDDAVARPRGRCCRSRPSRA